jgi:transcriptional regulator with XRE-family HTH domain
MEIPRGGWMELGERIAVLREEQALTQAELAEAARISPSTLSQIESGRVPRPHVGTVRKIARALGVEPAELRRAKEPAVPLAEAPREAGPPQVSREELVAQGILVTGHEVEELNNTIMGLWRLGQGEKAVAFFSHEDVDPERVGMLMHLVLDTPSIITPEAAGVVRQGIRERLKA